MDVNRREKRRPAGNGGIEVLAGIEIGQIHADPAADDFVRTRADWIAARLAERAAGPGPLAPPDREAALPVLRASLERMWPLVEPLGVKKPELKARFMTSRWGSCHYTKGLIVLNTALAAVEEELLEEAWDEAQEDDV